MEYTKLPHIYNSNYDTLVETLWEREIHFLQKIAIFIIGSICVILFYFTIVSVEKVFRTDWELPSTTGKIDTAFRLVLITQELETPFWDRVKEGALEQAQKDEGCT